MAVSFQIDTNRHANGFILEPARNPGLPTPIITAVTNPIVNPGPLVLSGSQFNATQGSGSVSIQATGAAFVPAIAAWSDITITTTSIDVETLQIKYNETVTVTVTADNGQSSNIPTTFNTATGRTTVDVASYNPAGEGVIQFTGTAPTAGDQVAYATDLYDATGTSVVAGWTVSLTDALVYVLTGAGTLPEADYTIKDVRGFDTSDPSWGAQEDITITIAAATAPTLTGVLIADQSWTQNVAIPNVDITTHFSDDIVSYTITPGLPTDVSLNTTTGIISGTPTVILAQTAYTVTATNTAGFINGTPFDIAVAASTDVTPPILSLPTGAATGDTTASGTVTTDEANGTLFYLIDSSITASLAAIKAGASQVVTTTGVQNVSSTGLTPSTGYYLHYVHTDAASNDSNVVHSTLFTTAATPDITAPVLSSPTGVTTGPNTASGSVVTDEGNGTLYFLADTSVTATVEAVKLSNSQGVTTTGIQNVSVLGLIPETTYYLHYVHTDASLNDSTVVNSLAFTTDPAVDVIPPVLSSPTGAATGANTATGTVTTDEGNGILYFLTSLDPTATQGEVKSLGLSQAVTTTGVQNVVSSGLNANTRYFIHYCHRDAAANDSGVVSSAEFTTTAGIQAPVFTGTIANQNSVVGDSVNIDLSTMFTNNPDTYATVVQSLPTGLTLNTTTGLISGSVTTEQTINGILLSATNVAGTAQTNSFNWIVSEPAVDPVFDTVPPVTGIVGIQYLYIPAASDPQNDIVTISAVTLPNWLSFTSGQVIGTPTENDVGQHNVSLQASDGVNVTVQNYLITVTVADRLVVDAPDFYVGEVRNPNDNEEEVFLGFDNESELMFLESNKPFDITTLTRFEIVVNNVVVLDSDIHTTAFSWGATLPTSLSTKTNLLLIKFGAALLSSGVHYAHIVAWRGTDKYLITKERWLVLEVSQVAT